MGERKDRGAQLRVENGGKQANCIFATAASNLARRFDILGR